MADTSTKSEVSGFRAADLLSLLRPVQWVKNVVVFAGPAAGLKLFETESLLKAFLAFAAFCLAASASYAINDTVDRRADAQHPTKKDRPVARGAVSPAAAVCLGLVLIFTAIAVAAHFLGRPTAFVVAVYFCLTLSYSLVLKRHVLVDVIVIATGFVLRALAGSLAVGVVSSKWLVACMFTLCLFLGFGKRRCELTMIGDVEGAGKHRKTLLRYTPDLLTHLITVSAGIAVITFLLYTIDQSGPASTFPKEHLFYTLPIVVYGVFRYAMLTELGVHGGPTEIMLTDKPLVGSVILWALAALVIAYQEKIFGAGGLTRLMVGG